MRFTVLASGSKGNASLLELDDCGILIDVGLGPRILASRLAAVRASWHKIRAVVLTHTHSDHWNDRTLAQLRQLRIPFYCHASHHATLSLYSSSAFAALKAHKLIHDYEPGEEFSPATGIRCRPLPLSHDSVSTFGFRFEQKTNNGCRPVALAYAADLGTWTVELARDLTDVDMLALEFNHDEILEKTSGRSAQLIARVLGDYGHLSNSQAAGLVREVMSRSAPGRLRHLVQLHLSRECNRPILAAEAARMALAEWADTISVHTAAQDRPSPRVILEGKLPSAQSETPLWFDSPVRDTPLA